MSNLSLFQVISLTSCVAFAVCPCFESELNDFAAGTCFSDVIWRLFGDFGRFLRDLLQVMLKSRPAILNFEQIFGPNVTRSPGYLFEGVFGSGPWLEFIEMTSSTFVHISNSRDTTFIWLLVSSLSRHGFLAAECPTQGSHLEIFCIISFNLKASLSLYLHHWLPNLNSWF